ncbi:MAG: acyl transferase [Bacteroidetes bacterium]|nr:acyl transferase [Bacteroidota bacterium]
MEFRKKIFRSLAEGEFNACALDLFSFQYDRNEIYRSYANAIGAAPGKVAHFSQIPFLPVSFFKTHRVVSGDSAVERTFLSSGTTGMERSRHSITDLSVYNESLVKGFEEFYGSLAGYDVFALTPDPVQNPDSSLIYMISKWIEAGSSKVSGFYLDRQEELAALFGERKEPGKKSLLIGLSYALIDFAEKFQLTLPGTVVMETGGMKGKRKEMIREELHAFLSGRFGCGNIHSEYGMTELLSQAYATENGHFRTPPWMKVVIRDTNDPFALLHPGKTGGINIIDLANYNSCSFLALQDLGKINEDGSFEVLGRFDFSDLRGCNLMVD